MSFTGIEAVRTVSADLGKAATQIAGLVVKVVSKSTNDIAAIAMAKAPRDTGFLAGSIGVELYADGNTVGGKVGPTANYGDYVESGTHKMAPQPYMGPATTAVEPQFIAAIEIASSRAF